MTSNQGDLTSRLQRRLGTERAEIEATAARELKVLGENLRGVAEQRTAYQRNRYGGVRSDGFASMLRCARGCGPLLFGLMPRCSASAAGSWAGGALAVDDHRAADRDAGRVLTRGHQGGPRRRWREIEENDVGRWTLREIDGERFVVLPAGTLRQSALDRGRAACFEAVESE